MRPLSQFALGALALAALAGGVPAQLITGVVVDALGVPQAGVNINVCNEGSGGDPDVFNGGTDLNGSFSTTVIPGGVFNIVFIPSPPNLITTLVDVTVAGTSNLGTVELLQGVTMTGRCVTAQGVPVAGVNLDVIDLATGTNLDLIGDNTDALGNFILAVPLGALEIRFDTTPVTFTTLASQALDVAASVDFNLGDVVLPDGHRIITLVQRPGGLPVPGADTDTVDTVTGQTLYTPQDNTSAAGLASVVVPDGIYEFEVCPTFGSQLVGQSFPVVVAGADVNLGLTLLQFGVVLQGTVSAPGGGGLAGVDIDVRDSATGFKLTTCNDKTDGGGHYQVVVPNGTWNVEFEPPYALPYSTLEQTSVLVAGSTTLNGTLGDCAFHSAYGAGTPGTGGFVPVYGSSGGAPRLGNPDYTLELSNGVGASTVGWILGFGPSAVPFKGGTLLVDMSLPFFLSFLPLGGAPGAPGAGALSIPAAVPNDLSFLGATAYTQFVVQDAGVTPFGLAFSNAVSISFCD
ncbi:MAG: hypothetical protein DRQ55_00635 [Planctomycetota bacterium]|nr:MAG: hypothetical protein DRQ55_00635 [Planctomycetota bacterium]